MEIQFDYRLKLQATSNSALTQKLNNNHLTSSDWNLRLDVALENHIFKWSTKKEKETFWRGGGDFSNVSKFHSYTILSCFRTWWCLKHLEDLNLFFPALNNLMNFNWPFWITLMHSLRGWLLKINQNQWQCKWYWHFHMKEMDLTFHSKGLHYTFLYESIMWPCLRFTERLNEWFVDTDEAKSILAWLS